MLNITIDGKELKNVIEKVQAAMLKSTYMASLKWIILKAEDGKFSASVTSLDSWLTVYAKEKYFCHKSDGKIAIDKEDAKVLCKITNNDVDIIEIDSGVIVKYGKKTITLMKQDVERYPTLKTEEYTNRLKSTESDLSDTFNNLSVFLDNNNHKKILGCLNLNLKETRWESLDGHRIGIKQIDYEDVYTGSDSCGGNLIIYNIAIKDLKKVLDKKSVSSPVFIAEGEEYINIHGKDFVYYIRKVDGEYFHVSEMMSKYGDYSFVVNREDALNHFKYYADTIVKKENEFESMVLKIEHDKLITYGKNARFEVSDELSINNFIGKEITIGFNPRYLVDAFKIADSDKLIIRGNNAISPIIIEADKYSFLILPVNLNKNGSIAAMEKYLNKINIA